MKYFHFQRLRINKFSVCSEPEVKAKPKEDVKPLPSKTTGMISSVLF